MSRARTTARGARHPLPEGSRRQVSAADADDPTTTPSTLDDAVASASSSSNAPASRSRATAAATRASTRGRLRPKVFRRDEAGREKLARQEEQKANEKAAAERSERGRSRARSRRSRGDAMGARAGRGITTASGPFSSGVARSGSASGGSRAWFGGAGSHAAGGVSGSKGTDSKSRAKGFGEADIRTREARINADKLHALTPDDEFDSEDEVMMAALSNRAVSTMPMGIYRREHKEQGIVVATTAELEAAENATGEEESLWVDGEGPSTLPPIDQPEEGTWGAGGKGALIKSEPGVEDPMEIDESIKPALTEELKGKTTTSMPSVKKELPADPEERAFQTNLDLLAAELGATTVTDEAGNITTNELINKDGRLYLFQLPPLIPPLKEISQPQATVKVKTENQDTPLSDMPRTSGTTPVDLTRSEAVDADVDDEDEEGVQAEGFRLQSLARGGLIGKLTVRRSGKTELDWGGMALKMSPGAGMGYLTTAVIVEENDEKPQHGITGGEAIDMGKIMGRFVLAPSTSEEKDWNVASEHLVDE